MTITDLVAPEAILPALKVNSKKQALQELAARAAVLTAQNERAIFEVLLQREKLGTTAGGHGAALQTGKAVRSVCAPRSPDRFRGDGRPTGRSGVSAAGAGRRGRRSPQSPGSDRTAITRSGRPQTAPRLARSGGD